MRALVVEDEPDILRAVATYLGEEGYDVDTADNGEDGLFKAITGEFDVIVLDVMLPGCDGWSILQELRRQNNSTPVVMLTARDKVLNSLKGLDAGADDFLVKPFKLSELGERVRALVRR